MEQSALLKNVGHLARAKPRAPRARQASSGERAEPDRRRHHAFAGSMWFVYIHIIWFAAGSFSASRGTRTDC